MNQKKCPKCGELNPPEAVMCWACYTPLSGDGGGGASAASRPSAVNEDKERRAAAPWQIGLVAVVLLGAIGFGVKTFLFTGGSEDAFGSTTAPPGTRVRPPEPGGNPIQGTVPIPGTNPGGFTPNQNPQIQPVASTYSVVASPNPKYTWGTLGIVPADPNTTPEQAAGMAAAVRQKMMVNKKWSVLHIYVFKDRQTGQAFRKYQSGRKGAPLGDGDYPALTNVWQNTLIRYEFNKGQEGVLRPNQNPTSWWGNKVDYSKAVR